jgi:uncharacterized protein
MSDETTVLPKKKIGFAAMDPARQRELARKGGKAAHEQGVGHEFDRETARVAGQKGGKAVHAKRRARLAAEGLTAENDSE